MVLFLVIFLVRLKMVPYPLVLLQQTSDSGIAKRMLKSFRTSQKHLLILLEIIAKRIEMTQLVPRLHFHPHKME